MNSELNFEILVFALLGEALLALRFRDVLAGEAGWAERRFARVGKKEAVLAIRLRLARVGLPAISAQ